MRPLGFLLRAILCIYDPTNLTEPRFQRMNWIIHMHQVCTTYISPNSLSVGWLRSMRRPMQVRRLTCGHRSDTWWHLLSSCASERSPSHSFALTHYGFEHVPNAPKMPPRCLPVSSRMCPRCLPDTSNMLPRCFPGASPMLPACFSGTAIWQVCQTAGLRHKAIWPYGRFAIWQDIWYQIRRHNGRLA